MNNEKQRIAIAEACGWKPNPFIRDMSGQVFPQSPPDYLNDLNAMHEAEKVLSRGAGYHQTGGFGLYKTALAEVCDEQHPIDATASQRAEAFLRTLGKWSID